jgi:hypothetical protein
MKRFSVLLLLAVLVALSIVAVRLVHPPRQGGPPAAAAAAAAPFPAAWSTTWSCAGPLPLGETGVKPAIELANSGGRLVEADVRFSATSGPGGEQSLAVPPGGVAVARPGPRARGLAAARVVAEGEGLSVVELLHGPFGPVAAPCAAATASTEYLLAGDTRKTDLVDVALFDPGATPAVASLSFATATGRTAPPTFQGVPVGAGQLVVLPLAERVPFQSELAVTVSSSGGTLAVGALDETHFAGASFVALETAARQDAAHWFFPTAPAGASASQTIDLFNPHRLPAHVELGFLPEGGSGRFGVIVPPGGLSRVSLPGGTAARTLGAPEVVSTNGVRVVAARELRIAALIEAAQLPSSNPARRAARALVLVPRLPIAYTVTEGVAAPERRWVLGGGEEDSSVGTFVEITDPTASAASVTVEPIGPAPAWRRVVPLPAGGSAVLNLADQPAASGRFALRVAATAPVVVDGALYAKGSVGFTSPAAIPD